MLALFLDWMDNDNRKLSVRVLRRRFAGNITCSSDCTLSLQSFYHHGQSHSKALKGEGDEYFMLYVLYANGRYPRASISLGTITHGTKV